MNLCYGIDFGTTNSCISVWYNNEPIIIEDFDGVNIIPTVIEFKNNKKIIGKEAYNRKEMFNKIGIDNFVIYEIKKLIGKKYSDLTNEELNLIGYNIKSDCNNNIIICDNNREYYIDEIVTHIFMSFYHFSNNFLTKKLNIEMNIKDVVISVPARFDDNQRELIKNCAINAGFNVIRLINEPTAGALAYNCIGNNKEQKIIVFDLGGGTLDISIMRIYENNYEVMASSGNTSLGGSNFDIKIMEYCIKEFIKQNNLIYEDFIENINENSLQKLKLLSEKSKIELSTNNETKITINHFYNDLNLNINLNRDKLNELCKDLINLIIKPLNEVLYLCELDKTDIDEIIMVGGMTKMPIIRRNIELFFNNKELNNTINPDNVVSIGASLYGNILINKIDIKNQIMLIDRTSLSIGIESSGGIMDIIIPRNSIIPIKKIKKYTTDMDNLESITIKVFEGERKFTKDNILIGEFVLTGIEKKTKGIPKIQITFMIDNNGIIKINALDLDNLLNKSYLQVNGNKNNLDEEQINKIIENAKIMDSIDRIDKMKKQSHQQLINNCNKILENIIKDSLKVENIVKNDVIENINKILIEIKDKNYEEIHVDVYKELINNFNLNYSIFLIHNEPIIELKKDETQNDTIVNNIGVDIYDDDDNKILKFEPQINYIRDICKEYSTYKYKLKKNNYVDDNEKQIINELLQKCFILLEYAEDLLVEFFIIKEITEEIIIEKCNELYKYDILYKIQFEEYEKQYNELYKLNILLKETENEYINSDSEELLETIINIKKRINALNIVVIN